MYIIHMKKGTQKHLGGESNTTLQDQRETVLPSKKQDNRYRFWMFTLFNYEEVEDELKRTLKKACKLAQYIHEICPKTGNPHLQGFFKVKKGAGCRFTELKKLFPQAIHLEATYADEVANLDYSSKVRDQGTNIFYIGPVKLRLPELQLDWQTQVMEIIKDEEPDTRTIHWIATTGNVGATTLCKYLVDKESAICATKGEYADLAQILAGAVKSGRDLNEKTVITFNYARSASGISYAGLESIKDGLITSTKYESSTIVFNAPHLLIFSNRLPDVSRFTLDRWKIWGVFNKKSPLLDITEGVLNRYAMCEYYSEYKNDLASVIEETKTA